MLEKGQKMNKYLYIEQDVSLSGEDLYDLICNYPPEPKVLCVEKCVKLAIFFVSVFPDANGLVDYKVFLTKEEAEQFIATQKGI